MRLSVPRPIVRRQHFMVRPLIRIAPRNIRPILGQAFGRLLYRSR